MALYLTYALTGKEEWTFILYKCIYDIPVVLVFLAMVYNMRKYTNYQYLKHKRELFLYFGLFLTSKVIILLLGFYYIFIRDKFIACFNLAFHDDGNNYEDKCDRYTGGYFTMIVALFNVGNIMFSLVVLHTKSVEDYIAKFSQHDT